MARQEKDRADLMAELRNLVERCELRPSGQEEVIVAGFRADGRLSIYFGPDPVYHFDLSGRVRRAYVADKLYKADNCRLIQLTRARTAGNVFLYRHELTQEETVAFLQEAQRRLRELSEALDRGACQFRRVLPADSDVIGRLHRLLASRRDGVLSVAPSPRSV